MIKGQLTFLNVCGVKESVFFVCLVLLVQVAIIFWVVVLTMKSYHWSRAKHIQQSIRGRWTKYKLVTYISYKASTYVTAVQGLQSLNGVINFFKSYKGKIFLDLDLKQGWTSIDKVNILTYWRDSSMSAECVLQIMAIGASRIEVNHEQSFVGCLVCSSLFFASLSTAFTWLLFLLVNS